MLADIGGEPLIVRTFQSVKSAGSFDLIVACDGEKIAEAIEKAGGMAVITDPELKSGTDRVFAAYKSYDKNGKYEFVINVQGDMPFVAPEFVKSAIQILAETSYDISTLATPIRDDSYLLENVVKPVMSFKSDGVDACGGSEIPFDTVGNAVYFSRSPVPFGGPYLHHVGVYGFRTEALGKFVSLPQSYLEKTEKLEQLRAMENGMKIGIKLLDMESPISVDTADDLEKARSYFEKNLA
jgi:3-deoxy-manno-octulosonate cytidylyltransferase (CMP-KDO synthetase)